MLNGSHIVASTVISVSRIFWSSCTSQGGFLAKKLQMTSINFQEMIIGWVVSKSIVFFHKTFVISLGTSAIYSGTTSIKKHHSCIIHEKKNKMIKAVHLDHLADQEDEGLTCLRFVKSNHSLNSACICQLALRSTS